MIDVRDLSAFVLDRVEALAGGLHNVVPDGPNTTMGELVDNAVLATGSGATPVWMDEGFLFSQGVQPWAELPLWIPAMPDTAGFWAVSGASAKAAGLRTRPFGESVRDPAARPREREGTARAGRVGGPLTTGSVLSQRRWGA